MINFSDISKFVKRNWLLITLASACIILGGIAAYMFLKKNDDTALQARTKKLEQALTQALEKVQAMGQSQEKNASQLKDLLKQLNGQGALANNANQDKPSNEPATKNPIAGPLTKTPVETQNSTKKENYNPLKNTSNDEPQDFHLGNLENIEKMFDDILNNIEQDQKNNPLDNVKRSNQQPQGVQQEIQERENGMVPNNSINQTHEKSENRPAVKLTDKDVTQVHKSFDNAQGKQTKDKMNQMAKEFLKGLVNDKYGEKTK